MSPALPSTHNATESFLLTHLLWQTGLCTSINFNSVASYRMRRWKVRGILFFFFFFVAVGTLLHIHTHILLLRTNSKHYYVVYMSIATKVSPCIYIHLCLVPNPNEKSVNQLKAINQIIKLCRGTVAFALQQTRRWRVHRRPLMLRNVIEMRGRCLTLEAGPDILRGYICTSPSMLQGIRYGRRNQWYLDVIVDNYIRRGPG
jgi:hypothetical protein